MEQNEPVRITVAEGGADYEIVETDEGVYSLYVAVRDLVVAGQTIPLATFSYWNIDLEELACPCEPVLSDLQGRPFYVHEEDCPNYFDPWS